jgi:hypothetical protein
VLNLRETIPLLDEADVKQSILILSNLIFLLFGTPADDHPTGAAGMLSRDTVAQIPACSRHERSWPGVSGTAPVSIL